MGLSYSQTALLELLADEPCLVTEEIARKLRRPKRSVLESMRRLRHHSPPLIKAEPSVEGVLRENNMLSRDSRMVERKKYGRKGARKGFQFSKR